MMSTKEERDEQLSKIDLPTPEIQFAIDAIGRRLPWGLRYERSNKLRVDLSATNLRKIKFSRWYNDEKGASDANFSFCDFTDCQMAGAEMTNVDFSNCIFLRTEMFDVTALSTNFTNAEFGEALMSNSTFSGANLMHARIADCVSINSDFMEVRLRETELNSNNFTDGDFSMTDVFNSWVISNNFSNVDFTSVDFKNSVVNSNIFEGAKFYNADLSKLNYKHSTNKIDILEALGDGSTKLPAGLHAPHWPDRILTWTERHPEKRQ